MTAESTSTAAGEAADPARTEADEGATTSSHDERRRGRFARGISRFTMAIHVPPALAFGEIFRRLGAPYPFLLGAVAAGAAYLPFPSVFAALLWDKPRGTLTRLLVQEPYFVHWCACFGSAAPITLVALLAPVWALVRGAPVVGPGNEALIATIGTWSLAIYGAFLLIAAYGVLVRRRWVAVNEIEIPVRGLPEAFDGYRIAQLSDLHIGGFSPLATGLRWARLTNEQKPDVIVLTGDYVTSGTVFHDDIAATVGALQAPDGVVVSMGNHDYFGEGDPLIDKLRARGVTVLRNASTAIERAGEQLRIGAVDDTWTGRDDLAATLRDGVPHVVLAHDPDLFESAARQGVPLMLSGHTHGGQVALPFFAERFNPARLRHKHTLGLYRDGDAYHYVHGGLGITGPPVRLGVPPEIAILTLRRAGS